MGYGSTGYGSMVHRDAVLGLLHDRPGLTRAEIARALGLARSTVSETVSSLIQAKVVITQLGPREASAGRGRPVQVLSLDPRAGFYLGIEVAHHRVSVLVANARGEVIGARTTASGPEDSWPDRIAGAVRLADSLATEGIVDYSGLHGVGVGLPGPYSRQWQRRDGLEFDDVGRLATELLQAHFASQILLDHHVRFAALAEAAAPGRADPANLLYVRLSGGVGSAMIVDGRLLRGEAGRAGELGHVQLVDGASARDCRCGKRGCLETVVSVPAVLRTCHERGLMIGSPAELGQSYEQGDPVAASIVEELIEALAQALHPHVVVLAPRELVLAGELAEALGADFRDRVATKLEPDRLPGSPPLAVTAAAFGAEAAPLGVVAALRQRARWRHGPAPHNTHSHHDQEITR